MKRGGPLKRTPLSRVGKIGKRNLSHSARCWEVFREHRIHICEIKGLKCCGGLHLTTAHRHKRSWYRKCPDLLSDYRQIICACVSCHNMIEHDKELTEKVFMTLRGPEEVIASASNC